MEEIMRINRSLPQRLSLDEIDTVISLVRNIKKEEQSRVDTVSKQRKGFDVPDELFFLLQEMQRNLIAFQSKEQKREALRLLDLGHIHGLFNEFAPRASKCCADSNIHSGGGDNPNGSFSATDSSYSSGTSIATTSSTTGFDFSSFVATTVSYAEKVGISANSELLYSNDDSFLKKAKSTFYADGIGLDSSRQSLLQSSTIKPATSSGGSRVDLILSWGLKSLSCFLVEQTFSGEALGCSFQGCFYLVTQDGLSIVLSSVYVSSGVFLVECIGYWQPSMQMSNGFHVENSLITKNPRDLCQLWIIEVLDRTHLYEGQKRQIAYVWKMVHHKFELMHETVLGD